MRSRLLLCLLVVLHTKASAQVSNYHPGYVVPNSGDTIRGEIFYTLWTTTPETITFRSNGSETKYGPKDLRAFGLDNYGQYRSAELSFHTPSSLDLGAAPEEYTQPGAPVRIFIERVISGKYNLYEYLTDIRRYYFIQKGDETPRELVYRVKVQDSKVIEDKQYQNVLIAMAVEEKLYTELDRGIRRDKYERGSLESIVAQLNHIELEQRKKTRNPGKLYVNAEAGIGIAQAQYNTSGQQSSSWIGSATLASHTTPVLRATLVLSKDPRVVGNRFYLQLGYHAKKIQGRSRAANIGTESVYESYDFTRQAFHVAPGAFFVFNPNSQFRFYAGAQLNINFSNSNKQSTQVKRSSDNSNYLRYEQRPLLRAVWYHPEVFGGVIYNRHRISLFYWIPGNISADRDIRVRTSLAGIGYFLALKKY